MFVSAPQWAYAWDKAFLVFLISLFVVFMNILE